MTKASVDLLTAEYVGVDPTRVYVTGISMGGYGVWDAIERWPDYFPAAVPVAGAGDPSHAAELAHVPIWDFHGADDTNVPVSGSRAMIQAIQAAGGSPRYTEFVGAIHTIWMQVYGDNTMLEWLFAQSNPSAAAHRTPRHMT